MAKQKDAENYVVFVGDSEIIVCTKKTRDACFGAYFVAGRRVYEEYDEINLRDCGVEITPSLQLEN